MVVTPCLGSNKQQALLQEKAKADSDGRSSEGLIHWPEGQFPRNKTLLVHLSVSLFVFPPSVDFFSPFSCTQYGSQSTFLCSSWSLSLRFLPYPPGGNM